MTITEQYIQFAIDNWWENNIKAWVVWYDIINHNLKDKDNITLITNFIENITSLSFIKAIAKWLNNSRLISINPNYWITIDTLTKYQAIAIRDNKLEDFILNFLNIWK